MLNHAVEFYKILFAEEEDLGVSLDESFQEPEDLVTISENEMLECPFSEEEIRVAVLGSYAEGAPRPYGFPFLFYQTFWEDINDDFMNLVRRFEADNLNLDRINYAMITLIPKEQDAKDLKKFRPISLIN